MQTGTKVALGIAAAGYAINKYQAAKISTEKPYLETDEWRLQFAGKGATVLGLASAGIIEYTKDKPKIRKVAFVGLGGVIVLYFFGIMMALKKMS